MRKHGKIDLNQKAIVESLQKIPGVSVCSLASLGDGTPDILIGYKGVNYLSELKSTNKAQLTEKQKKFHSEWKGQVCICRSLEDVLKTIGIIE